MKNRISILAFAIFALASIAGAEARSLQSVAAGQPIPGQYIVVLDESRVVAHGRRGAAERRDDIRVAADELAALHRGKRQHVFSESLTGFSVRIDAAGARRLAADPRVAMVAQDSIVETTSIQTAVPSWGLDRIDQRDLPLDDTFQWVDDPSVSDVHVYVLDTGIRSTHEDFGVRVDVVNSYDVFTGGPVAEDCHGHGTHVAGIVGGSDHGVAKNVTLHPVRVLSCSGSGSVSTVLAGIDWLTTRVIDAQHAAVVNLSLATSPSTILDNAIRTSIEAGIVYVAAAGNNADSACNYSPARVAEVITVGASDSVDSRLATSNHGECVDLYAPGAGIVSTYHRNDGDTISMSGTS
ncbi:MAG: S8 family serine peptidase, partial [Wenzhouxiangellaceae bacterium]|nr:S8 family serine peptidase [Wenzhouxiangellaceae bacterium]